jgi:hypothetical protein
MQDLMKHFRYWILKKKTCFSSAIRKQKISKRAHSKIFRKREFSLFSLWKNINSMLNACVEAVSMKHKFSRIFKNYTLSFYLSFLVFGLL